MPNVVVAQDVDNAEAAFLAAHPNLFSQTPWGAAQRNREILPRIASGGGRVIDLGGGVSSVAGLLARLGCEPIVFDNFEYDIGWISATGDAEFTATTARRRQALADDGVRFVDCDLCEVSLADYFPPGSVDVITSFHCFEHLHHSPRRLLGSALDVLKPGGLLLIETPNSVNLLKRAKVAAGYTNYASFHDYWNAEVFGGHVREYSFGDFEKLATLLGIKDYTIYGRNWFGTLNHFVGQGLMFCFVDGILKVVPGWCGSLFFEARKS